MELYAGIDLHSSNNYIGVINELDERLYSKRHSNRMDDILPGGCGVGPPEPFDFISKALESVPSNVLKHSI